MKKIDIVRMKNIQMEILYDIHTFCLKNNIQYSLSGGTLLGAIRHKGYIPWDDDIDLMMPRPDYNRFLQLYTSPINKIIDCSTSEVCEEMFAKVYRKGTYMVDKNTGACIYGVNVDIFPVEATPSLNIEQYVQEILDKKAELPRILPFYKVVNRHKMWWMLKYYLKRVRYWNFTPILKAKARLNDYIATYNYNQAEYVGAFLGSNGLKELLPKSDFSTSENVWFEGKEFCAIAGYKNYLSSLYGDYMQLPPVEKRISHHPYDAYEE